MGTAGGNRALASNPASGVDVGSTGYLPGLWDYRIFVEASSLDLPGMWQAAAGHKRSSS